MCFEPGEAPGSEWDEIYERAAIPEGRRLGRGGRAAREPFIRGGVGFELRGGEAAFAALRGAPPGAQVYIIRDASERITYVGIVEPGQRNALIRLRDHLANKPGEFLGDASSIEVVGVGLEERQARALEDELISQHHPKWNARERDPQSYSRKYGGTRSSPANPVPVQQEVQPAFNFSARFKIGLQPGRFRRAGQGQ